MPVDVRLLGVDFLALSGHKMLGPSGIGALWGRRELLDAMPPFMTGGSMITRVTLDGAEWNEVPWKFDAGTPAIAQAPRLEAAGLAASAASPEGAGRATSRRAAPFGCARSWAAPAARPGVRRRGPGATAEHAGVISFGLVGIRPPDVATILAGEGVAGRAGH